MAGRKAYRARPGRVHPVSPRAAWAGRARRPKPDRKRVASRQPPFHTPRHDQIRGKRLPAYRDVLLHEPVHPAWPLERHHSLIPARCAVFTDVPRPVDERVIGRRNVAAWRGAKRIGRDPPPRCGSPLTRPPDNGSPPFEHSIVPPNDDRRARRSPVGPPCGRRRVPDAAHLPVRESPSAVSASRSISRNRANRSGEGRIRIIAAAARTPP